MRAFVAAAFAVLMASLGAKAEAPPTAAGFWETYDKDGKPQGWFLVAEKGGIFSARLVKGFPKPGEPLQLTCTKCPGERKGAQMMGLTLFYGFKRDGLAYADGHVIDPRDGKIWNAKMDLSEDGQTLDVHGYWGVSLLGKSVIWKRLPDDAMKAKDIPKETLAKDAAPTTAAAQ